jgi:ABC-type uncharacterized transport system ATPase subunit
MTFAVEMHGITKAFARVLANDRIDFSVRKGEIHALVGENGAGKSTLMRILYGLYQPDAGSIRIMGRRFYIKSPADAISAGIGMVHQSFMLIPAFRVIDNVMLGMEVTGKHGLFLNSDAASRQLNSLSEKYALKITPLARVDTLSVGEQQRVEIIKLLFREAQILILDEPTSILTPQEIDNLFAILHRLKSEGHTIILITHKLNEVKEISDRLTVLRDGRAVGERLTAETTAEQIAQMMVGREVLFEVGRPEARIGPPLLQARGLSARNRRGVLALREASLDVHAGEILGIAGVEGNGQSELADVLTGLLPLVQGQIAVRNSEITGMGPEYIFEAGLAHIPEDRQGRGLVLDFSVSENLILGRHHDKRFANPLGLRSHNIEANAMQLVENFDIRPAEIHLPVRHLSGGNQQKVVLAREFARNAFVLIASHPTRGLDIGATEFVHHQLLKKSNEGCAILLISADLNEILSLSDRIAVMYEGRIVATRKAAETNERELGLLMTGSLSSPEDPHPC